MSFNVGEMVGPYRVIEQLGQGGMATVYKAYHAALDRYIAIKVLHPAFLEDRNFLARFQREARLVAKLEHPNIVPIYDYAEHEGRPYLVMKFIEGETLKARHASGPINHAEVQHIVEAVGAALAFAHKRGILHRDIKPSNVLMTTDDEIYLADFGLARIAQSGEATLTSDMILGTPQYISPEQALGKKDLDAGTDIYSFGVMLYELTVGRVPFSGDTPFSVIHDHIYTPLPLPRQVNPQVTEEVERVLLKALSKERHDRYKDIHGMVDAFLQAWRTVPHPSLDVKTSPRSSEMPTAIMATTTVGEDKEGTPEVRTAPVETQEGKHFQPVLAEKSAPENQATKPKRRIPWMWIAVAVILVVGCLFTYASLRTYSWRGTISSPSSIMSTGINTPTLPQPTDAISDVLQAEQYATENPNNPDAQLLLVMVYWNADLPDSAQKALTDLEKIPALDKEFCWTAGTKLATQNAWLLAARLDVDAANLSLKKGIALTNPQSNQLHEAIYKAFLDKQAPVYILSEHLDAIDKPMGVIAKARNTFYYGDKDQAQEILTALLKSKPNMPEAQLLQAEFYAKNGQTAAAQTALSRLKNNQAVKDWMLTEAAKIEGTIK